MEDTFRVVSLGMTAGQDAAATGDRIAALFKRPPGDVAMLLNKERCIVKKGLALHAATRYQQALANCGLDAAIEPEAISSARQAIPSEEQVLPRLHAAPRAAAAGACLLAGDLAVTFGADADGPDLDRETIVALGHTPDQLLALASNNLHVRIDPTLSVQQMRLQAPDGAPADAIENMQGFFHYLETGSGLEAACILVRPIWDTVGALVNGPLRIVVPNRSTCMFCGANDPVSLAMMSDIARDVYAESGEHGLSPLVYTYDAQAGISVADDGVPAPVPARAAGEKEYRATNPGGIELSESRLLALQPEIDDPQVVKPASREGLIAALRRNLKNGDARAAVVVDAPAGMVAAYTDELDCVVLLHFDPALVSALGWKHGERLLSVNTYGFLAEQGLAEDLTPAPGKVSEFGQVWPLIADLLTDDQAGLAATKTNIGEAEWQRCFELGRQLRRARSVTARDGRPLASNWPVTGSPPERADPEVQMAAVEVLKAALLALVCISASCYAAVSMLSMEKDLLFVFACFGVLFFGWLGISNAMSVYSWLRKRDSGHALDN